MFIDIFIRVYQAIEWEGIMKKILFFMLFLVCVSTITQAQDIAYLYKSFIRQPDKPDQAFTLFELHKDHKLYTVTFDGFYTYTKWGNSMVHAKLETQNGQIFAIKKDKKAFVVTDLSVEKQTPQRYKIRYNPSVFYWQSDLQTFFESDNKRLRFSQYMPSMQRAMPMLIKYQGDVQLTIGKKNYNTKKYLLELYFTRKEEYLEKIFFWFNYTLWWDKDMKRVVKTQYKLSDTVEVISEFDKVVQPKSGISLINNGNADVLLEFKKVSKRQKK